MARCGCTSVGATGAAMQSSSCIEVSGAGTAVSPFRPDIVIADLADNLIECTIDGLYARAPLMTSDNDSLNVEEGAGPGDFDFSVRLSDNDFQQLSVVADGLLARSNIEIVGVGGVVAGTPPTIENGRWQRQEGTIAQVTGGDGRISVAYPETFPGGVIAPRISFGDVHTIPHFAEVDLATVTTSGFSVLIRDFDGTTTVGVNIRLNWEVTGW